MCYIKFCGLISVEMLINRQVVRQLQIQTREWPIIITYSVKSQVVVNNFTQQTYN